MDLTWMENWLIWGWVVEIWQYNKKVVLSSGLSEETVVFRGKAEICKNKKGLKHYKYNNQLMEMSQLSTCAALDKL